MSTTFNVTRNDIINGALRLQGWLDYQGTADATKISNMAEALQIMIKAWSAEGMKLWTIEEQTLPLVTGQIKYTIGPTGNLVGDRPLKIIEAFIRYTVSGNYNDVTLQRLSRNEYQMLGNKASSGTPNSFFYNPVIPNGELYVYVAPSSFASANDEIHLFVQRLIQDINAAGDSFDLPQEWFQALKWGLADETSLENQIADPVADRIAVRAKYYREQLEDWDQENASIYFQPDMQRMQIHNGR